MANDPVLDALFADQSPEARLIAADWLDEHGMELQALMVRYGVCYPPTEAPTTRHVGSSGGWDVYLFHPTLAYEIVCRPIPGNPSLKDLWSLSVGHHKNKGWLARPLYRRGKWKPRKPPAGLEQQVTDLLRKRLAEKHGTSA